MCILLENIVAWADKVGGQLVDVPFEQRRDNNVRFI